MSEHVAISIKPEGYAVLTLQKEPVNSLDLDLWQGLNNALTVLEDNQNVFGVIIMSGLSRDVFSAGNDLRELYAPQTSKERYTQFWLQQNEFLARLYSSRLATLAAIRGACPAGGCMISMCCDMRLMTSAGFIGLNEVALGIPVPKYWGLLMGRIIGSAAAERLLLAGRMLPSAEALRLGLVDELLEAGRLASRAEEVMRGMVKLPAAARLASKTGLREDFVQQWRVYCSTEPEGAWEFLSSERTVQLLAAALARLSKGSSKL